MKKLLFALILLAACEKLPQGDPGNVIYCIECRDNLNQVYDTCGTLNSLNAWEKNLKLQKDVTCIYRQK